MARPAIHQKISPARGQVTESQSSLCTPPGTKLVRPRPMNPAGMFKAAGAARRSSARSAALLCSCVGGVDGTAMRTTSDCSNRVGRRRWRAERSSNAHILRNGHRSTGKELGYGTPSGTVKS
jgi:hypothetical protein